MTVINTNARSLCPKINSLIDCFNDLDGTLGVVTQTWLSDGDSLEEDIEGLCLGTGLGMVCLNRTTNDRGFSHGGVAVIFRASEITMRRVKLHNPHKYEVLMTIGMLTSCAWRVVMIACYLPPNSTVGRAREAMEFIAGAISEAKRRYDNPLVVLAGDYN